MGLEAIIGIVGLVVSVTTYFLGIHQGRKQEASRIQHDWDLERDRRLHGLAAKMTDEYVRMARAAYDNGPHALSRLGLDQLGSDGAIREAIAEMHTRSGANPWARWANHVEDIDLVAFFRLVREEKINLILRPLDVVVTELKNQGKLPPRPG